MKKLFIFIWEIAKLVIISLLIVVPLRYYVFQPYIVRGASMEPNFHSGDYLIVDEISYRFREPQRGEVIIFKAPVNSSDRYIKRIVGLPGETVIIENGQVIIKNEAGRMVLKEDKYLSPLVYTPGQVHLTLKEDEYFVLGDNRTASFDSRQWGVLPRKNIIGCAWLRLWPVNALTKFIAPSYQ
ncbi:MAG: signal peptidase I [Minisyncoccales bacterium]